VFGGGGRVGAGRNGEDRSGGRENGRSEEDADSRTGERGVEKGGFHELVPLMSEFLQLRFILPLQIPRGYNHPPYD
jgi:hypothetical protein